MQHVGNHDLYGKTIRVGFNKSHLILNKERRSLLYVSIDTQNPASFEIKKDIGGFISDHHCISESRVIAVTDDGWIIMFKYDTQLNTSSILSRFKIPI
jgi:hypothetical protein